MPSGRLGKSALAANVDVDVYTVPAGVVATANVNICNTGDAEVVVRVAVRSGPLADSDYIEHGLKLPPGGVLERTGIALSAGETITVRSDTAGVAVRVHGFEESL